MMRSCRGQAGRSCEWTEWMPEVNIKGRDKEYFLIIPEKSRAEALNSRPEQAKAEPFISGTAQISGDEALPEAGAHPPFETAALTVCALCAYAAAPGD